MAKKTVKGQENLIPLNKRPKDEQRRIQQMGVEASREARKNAPKKKDLLSLCEKVMNLQVADSQVSMKKMMASLGVEEEDMVYWNTIIVAMMAKAAKGDVPAAKFFLEVQKMIEERNKSKIEAGTEGGSLADTIEEAYKERMKDTENAE